eukprot:TCONS_00007113-protein
MSMEDLSMKDRLKYLKRRFSRKGSYEVDFNSPKFKVKSLCSEGIHVDSLEREASNEAVDQALGTIGSLEDRNKNDVVLKVSLRNGIEVISRKTRKELFSYRIHQVGYCNVDKRYPQVFVFTAAKVKDELKCYVFLCDDAAKAKAICLTLAKVFQSSFSNWQKSKDMADDLDQHNLNNMDDSRRKSESALRVSNMRRMEERRASDFVTTSSTGLLAPKRLDVRRSSADARYDHESTSDEDSNVGDMDEMYSDYMSKSVEKGTCSLLRRGSTDWDAIEKDSEIQRKMQGDMIVWED